MMHRPLVLVLAVITLASCGGRSESSRVRADAVMDSLEAASVCDLELLEGVARLGGYSSLAEDEPLFTPIYHAAGWGTGDVRAVGSEPAGPGEVAEHCLEQARRNADEGATRAPLFVRSQMNGLEFTQRGEAIEGRVVLHVGAVYAVDCDFQLKVVAGVLEPVLFRLPVSGFRIMREVGGRFRPAFDKADRDG